MREKLILKGEWYLPVSTDNRVSGILTFDDDQGGSLELFDYFENDLFLTFPNNESIILGLSTDGKPITLVECLAISSKSVNKIADRLVKTVTIFRVRYILIGALVNNIEDLLFDRAFVQIHNLAEWLDISGIDVVDDIGIDKTANEVYRTINISYKTPKPVSFKIDHHTMGRFTFENAPFSSTKYQFKASVEQITEFEIISEISISLDKILNYLLKFQNFIIIALYHPTFIVKIQLEGQKFLDKIAEDFNRPAEITLLTASSQKIEYFKPKYGFECLFTYENIKMDFQSLIEKWFKIYDEYEPSLYHLFYQFYNHRKFNENSFLNLAQAVESFHERNNKQTRIPKEEYLKMKESILEVTPIEYHHWLNEQFKFGNAMNLEYRLRDLVTTDINPILSNLIGDTEDFIKKVKHSRNYYTHLSEKSERKASKGRELMSLTYKLKLLLTVAFLREIGIENKTISKWISSGSRFLV